MLCPSYWRGTAQLFAVLYFFSIARAKLECDPSSDIKKADPENPETYLYCNLEGAFSRRKCVSGKLFDAKSGQCEPIIMSDAPHSDPFSQPFFQAPGYDIPDDLCGSGIPLTILSAPVACNPSISSCPDGYVCRMYERTGTSYCCQNPSPTSEDQNMCSTDQVTYIEPSTGRPRSCVLGGSDTCPVGFGCNLVAGTTTRCCGKDFGCPFNAAGFINPNTGSHVECNPKNANPCQRGFQCARSATFNKFICCSNADSDARNTQCPNGDSPLASPSRCSAETPCPSGYVCSDDKCCPAIGVCPAGLPLGGGVTVCNENHPCQDGYECITTAGAQYCCPRKEMVCTQQKHSGTKCANSRNSVSRYYFDQSTGSCRSFQYSQCGGNANNFNSLEECEGFCVDSQCANGQAYRVGAVNAACSMSSLNTCPRQHVCTTPAFGPSPICCPIQELTCNEMVSAGTPCFGKQMTVQRYYFNPSSRKCVPFQYYGCNGNGNNFHSFDQCQDFCLNAVDTACGGVGPLLDPNNRAQKCDGIVGCPDGYTCNPEGYCCPETKTACGASMSRGNVCAGTAPRTMWYYDTAQQNCRQFLYNGCGGTSNRFTSQTICSATCLQASTVGQCPRGMTAFVEPGDIAPKACTLNVRGSCPSSSSCVRSTSNIPICCQTVHSCPEGRHPYNIPGSTSVVACNIENDTCPRGNVCLESGTIAGFHLCCSSSSNPNSITNQQRPQKGGRSRGSSKNRGAAAKNGGSSSSLAALLGQSPCPSDLESNGMTCTVNAINGCPDEHLCMKMHGYADGTCCRAPIPRCAQKGHIPVLLTDTQVQICETGEYGCPSDAKCQNTNIPDVKVCCRLYSAGMAKTGNVNTFGGNNFGSGNSWETENTKFGKGFGNKPGMPGNFNGMGTTNENTFNRPLGSMGANSIHESVAGRCKNGDRPYRDDNNMVMQCNVMQPKVGECPGGFKCEFSNAGVAVCCADLETIKCPANAKPFEYGGRPLACPPGSTKCPSGFSCVPSLNPIHHLCCSDGSTPKGPTCASGTTYRDSHSNEVQYCSPLRDNCPVGHHCLESTLPGQFICCTQDDLDEQYAGFCPPRQIPHVDYYGDAVPCHMSLKPCPNNAPYVCIYSAEKQDSFCCAPIDSAARQYHPSISTMGSMSKLSNFGNGNNNFRSKFGNGNGFSVNNNFGNNGFNNGFNNGMGNMKVVTMPTPGKIVPAVGISDLEKKEMEKGRQLAMLAMQRERLLQQQLANKKSGKTTSEWEVIGGGEDEVEKAKKLGESIAQQLRFSSHDLQGCPAGSKPLVGSDRSAVTCDSTPCPTGFACLFADEVNRWQCCSTGTAVSIIPTNTTGSNNGTKTVIGNNTSTIQTSGNQTGECPFGFYMIDGKCLKVLYVGQKGCISDDQCASREPNASCDSGYCICPAAKPLVHESKCVSSCPEGFSNIAGRCYDPTTVIFMDSVDERSNGTIGGYCLDTLIEEKRCLVNNAYCSEKTVTCTCKPGFELDMDFNKKGDQGSCKKLSSTKFDEPMSDVPEPVIDEELYFIDIGPNKMNDAIEEKSTKKVAEDEDLDKYLMPQGESAIPVFA